MAVGVPAMAAPSFYGYTGLVTIPTADALDEGQYSIGAFALDVEEGVDSNVYTANLGLAEALELGFARLKTEGAPGETIISAKYRFFRETAEHPAIAAGVIDFTDEIDSTSYIVASKSIRWRGETTFGEITAPRVHIGAAGGQIDGLFAGFSAAFGNRLLLMAEYDSQDVNFGARLAISDALRIHAALLDADNLGLGISFSKVF